MEIRDKNACPKLKSKQAFGIIITNCYGSLLYVDDYTKELLHKCQLNLEEFTLCALESPQNMFFVESCGHVISVCNSEANILDQHVKLIYLQNQSDLLRTEKELYIYKTFLDSISDQGIMIIDEETRIIMYNTVASYNDSTPKEMVLGKKYEELYNVNDSKMIQTLLTGKAILDKENIYKNPEGKTIISFGCTYPIKYGERTVASAAVIRWQNNVFNMLNRMRDFQTRFFSTINKGANNTSYTFDDIVGASPAIINAINIAKRAASHSSSPIFVYGETGTGKELFVQSIHNASLNHDSPFLAVNCAAIPEHLLESTLFGTVKGAFTGAENTIGLFEEVKDGTLLLDEINLMPFNLQSKLLRVLEEKTFRKVGSNTDIHAGCRIIATTNISPEECIKNKTLRMDLFYRLSVINIAVPPLRERDGDIELLVKYFINKYSILYDIEPMKVHSCYLDALNSCSWPGNVRQLQHIVESTLIMTNSNDGLFAYHLPHHITTSMPAEHTDGRTIDAEFISDESHISVKSTKAETVELIDSLEDLEKKIILQALLDNNGNISRAAESIGISRSNLHYRMKRLNISKE